MAFAKAQLAADNRAAAARARSSSPSTTPTRPTVTPIARRFHEMGFKLVATAGTARYLQAQRDSGRSACSRSTRGGPNGIDLIVNGEVQLLINTPLGKHAQQDDYTLRQAAIAHARRRTRRRLSAASAACDAILSLPIAASHRVRSLQEWHARAAPTGSGPSSGKPFIHESAYVDDGATIGDGTKVWHFCSRDARRSHRRALLARTERRRDERT